MIGCGCEFAQTYTTARMTTLNYEMPCSIFMDCVEKPNVLLQINVSMMIEVGLQK